MIWRNKPPDWSNSLKEIRFPNATSERELELVWKCVVLLVPNTAALNLQGQARFCKQRGKEVEDFTFFEDWNAVPNPKFCQRSCVSKKVMLLIEITRDPHCCDYGLLWLDAVFRPWLHFESLIMLQKSNTLCAHVIRKMLKTMLIAYREND